MLEARTNSYGLIFKNRPFRMVVCLITLGAFLFNTFYQDLAWAAKGPMELTSLSSKGAVSPTLSGSLNVRTFHLPEYLGHIKDSWAPVRGQEKQTTTIIHIQDAHCNYYAQHRISEIIDYLNTNYGVYTVNLEGGAKDYNLSIFTDIADKSIREKVADYFVKEGMVNGSEYYAINNPDKVNLWGIEDVDLYLDNLKVYRDSLKHKEEIDKYIKSLNYLLNNLKTKMYSKELLEFDLKYSAYKAEKLEFKDYLNFLMAKAKERLIDIKSFANIYILAKTLGEETNIDFRKANRERDALMDAIQKKLSRNALAELVAKAVEFKQERISQKEFYAYITDKAKQLDVDPANYPELKRYMLYVSMYEAIDKAKIMEEVDALEDRVKESLYKNDKDRQLANLSKTLALTKNIFNISLSIDDYRFYKAHKSDFDVSNYTRFIYRETPLFGITAKLEDGVEKLDAYREYMSKFYECSFKRDRAFVKNMKLKGSVASSQGPGSSAAIIVTGGFHTENLAELFRKNSIAYISIMPNFKNCDGYECPYFNLLAGKPNPANAKIDSFLNSTLAVASFINSISELVHGDREILRFHINFEIAKAAAQGKGVKLVYGNKELALGPSGEVVPLNAEGLVTVMVTQFLASRQLPAPSAAPAVTAAPVPQAPAVQPLHAVSAPPVEKGFKEEKVFTGTLKELQNKIKSDIEDGAVILRLDYFWEKSGEYTKKEFLGLLEDNFQSKYPLYHPNAHAILKKIEYPDGKQIYVLLISEARTYEKIEGADRKVTGYHMVSVAMAKNIVKYGFYQLPGRWTFTLQPPEPHEESDKGKVALVFSLDSKDLIVEKMREGNAGLLGFDPSVSNIGARLPDKLRNQIEAQSDGANQSPLLNADKFGFLVLQNIDAIDIDGTIKANKKLLKDGDITLKDYVALRAALLSLRIHRFTSSRKASEAPAAPAVAVTVLPEERAREILRSFRTEFSEGKDISTVSGFENMIEAMALAEKIDYKSESKQGFSYSNLVDFFNAVKNGEIRNALLLFVITFSGISVPYSREDFSGEVGQIKITSISKFAFIAPFILGFSLFALNLGALLSTISLWYMVIAPIINIFAGYILGNKLKAHELEHAYAAILLHKLMANSIIKASPEEAEGLLGIDSGIKQMPELTIEEIIAIEENIVSNISRINKKYPPAPAAPAAQSKIANNAEFNKAVQLVGSSQASWIGFMDMAKASWKNDVYGREKVTDTIAKNVSIVKEELEKAGIGGVAFKISGDEIGFALPGSLSKAQVMAILVTLQKTLKNRHEGLYAPYMPVGCVRVENNGEEDANLIMEKGLRNAEIEQSLAKEKKNGIIDLIRVNDNFVFHAATAGDTSMIAGSYAGNIEKAREDVRKTAERLGRVYEVEDIYPSLKRESLWEVVNKARFQNEPGIYLIRGPPDSFYVVRACTGGKVQVIKIENEYRPDNEEMKGKFDAILEKSGRTGNTRGDYSFKCAQDSFDHTFGNELIMLENLGIYDAFKPGNTILSEADISESLDRVTKFVNSYTGRVGFTVVSYAYTASPDNITGEAAALMPVIERMCEAKETAKRSSAGKILTSNFYDRNKDQILSEIEAIRANSKVAAEEGLKVEDEVLARSFARLSATVAPASPVPAPSLFTLFDGATPDIPVIWADIDSAAYAAYNGWHQSYENSAGRPQPIRQVLQNDMALIVRLIQERQKLAGSRIDNNAVMFNLGSGYGPLNDIAGENISPVPVINIDYSFSAARPEVNAAEANARYSDCNLSILAQNLERIKNQHNMDGRTVQFVTLCTDMMGWIDSYASYANGKETVDEILNNIWQSLEGEDAFLIVTEPNCDRFIDYMSKQDGLNEIIVVGLKPGYENAKAIIFHKKGSLTKPLPAPAAPGAVAKPGQAQASAEKPQIGKLARATEIIREGSRSYLRVIDSRGETHDIILNKKSNQQLLAALKSLEEKENSGSQSRQILEEFLAILQTSPPEFYTFNAQIEDLLGYTPADENIITLSKAITQEPLRSIAIFHELGHYLYHSKKLELSLRKDVLTLTINGRQFKFQLDPETLAIASKGQHDQHYLLRALQRAMFGARDTDITRQIKSIVTPSAMPETVAGYLKWININFEKGERVAAGADYSKLRLNSNNANMSVLFQTFGSPAHDDVELFALFYKNELIGLIFDPSRIHVPPYCYMPIKYVTLADPENRVDMVKKLGLIRKYFKYNPPSQDVRSSWKIEPCNIELEPESSAFLEEITEKYGPALVGFPGVFPTDLTGKGATSKAVVETSYPLIKENDKVLVVGCGRGIDVIAAALKAKSVDAIDLNEFEIENTRLNLKRWGLNNVNLIKNKGLEGLEGTYDVIIFNAPLIALAPKGTTRLATYDANGDINKDFLSRLKDYLTPTGFAIYSNDYSEKENKYDEKSNKEFLNDLFAEYGLSAEFIGTPATFTLQRSVGHDGGMIDIFKQHAVFKLTAQRSAQAPGLQPNVESRPAPAPVPLPVSRTLPQTETVRQFCNMLKDYRDNPTGLIVATKNWLPTRLNANPDNQLNTSTILEILKIFRMSYAHKPAAIPEFRSVLWAVLEKHGLTKVAQEAGLMPAVPATPVVAAPTAAPVAVPTPPAAQPPQVGPKGPIVGAMTEGRDDEMKRLRALKRWLRIKGYDIVEWANSQKAEMDRELALKDKAKKALVDIGLSESRIKNIADRIILSKDVGIRLEDSGGQASRIGGLIIGTSQGLMILFPQKRIDGKNYLPDLLHEVVEVLLLDRYLSVDEAHLRANEVRNVFIQNGKGAAMAKMDEILAVATKDAEVLNRVKGEGWDNIAPDPTALNMLIRYDIDAMGSLARELKEASKEDLSIEAKFNGLIPLIKTVMERFDIDIMTMRDTFISTEVARLWNDVPENARNEKDMRALVVILRQRIVKNLADILAACCLDSLRGVTIKKFIARGREGITLLGKVEGKSVVVKIDIPRISAEVKTEADREETLNALTARLREIMEKTDGEKNFVRIQRIIEVKPRGGVLSSAIEVSEYVEGVTMKDIVNHPEFYDVGLARMMDIIIQYINIHQILIKEGFINNDIRNLTNILIDRNYTAKFCDYGLVRRFPVDINKLPRQDLKRAINWPGWVRSDTEFPQVKDSFENRFRQSFGDNAYDSVFRYIFQRRAIVIAVLKALSGEPYDDQFNKKLSEVEFEQDVADRFGKDNKLAAMSIYREVMKWYRSGHDIDSLLTRLGEMRARIAEIEQPSEKIVGAATEPIKPAAPAVPVVPDRSNMAAAVERLKREGRFDKLREEVEKIVPANEADAARVKQNFESSGLNSYELDVIRQVLSENYANRFYMMDVAAVIGNGKPCAMVSICESGKKLLEEKGIAVFKKLGIGVELSEVPHPDRKDGVYYLFVLYNKNAIRALFGNDKAGRENAAFIIENHPELRDVLNNDMDDNKVKMVVDTLQDKDTIGILLGYPKEAVKIYINRSERIKNGFSLSGLVIRLKGGRKYEKVLQPFTAFVINADENCINRSLEYSSRARAGCDAVLAVLELVSPIVARDNGLREVLSEALESSRTVAGALDEHMLLQNMREAMGTAIDKGYPRLTAYELMSVIYDTYPEKSEERVKLENALRQIIAEVAARPALPANFFADINITAGNLEEQQIALTAKMGDKFDKLSAERSDTLSAISSILGRIESLPISQRAMVLHAFRTALSARGYGNTMAEKNNAVIQFTKAGERNIPYRETRNITRKLRKSYNGVSSESIMLNQDITIEEMKAAIERVKTRLAGDKDLWLGFLVPTEGNTRNVFEEAAIACGIAQRESNAEGKPVFRIINNRIKAKLIEQGANPDFTTQFAYGIQFLEYARDWEKDHSAKPQQYFINLIAAMTGECGANELEDILKKIFDYNEVLKIKPIDWQGEEAKQIACEAVAKSL